MEIVHQLGELFLQAVPTVLIVLLFYLFLRANFFKPLERVMTARLERTLCGHPAPPPAATRERGSMNLRRAIFFAATVSLLALVLLAAPVLAAEAAEQNPAETPIGEVFQWLNFFIVFGGLGYFIAKKAPAY